MRWTGEGRLLEISEQSGRAVTTMTSGCSRLYRLERPCRTLGLHMWRCCTSCRVLIGQFRRPVSRLHHSAPVLCTPHVMHHHQESRSPCAGVRLSCFTTSIVVVGPHSGWTHRTALVVFPTRTTRESPSSVAPPPLLPPDRADWWLFSAVLTFSANPAAVMLMCLYDGDPSLPRHTPPRRLCLPGTSTSGWHTR